MFFKTKVTQVTNYLKVSKNYKVKVCNKKQASEEKNNWNIRKLWPIKTVISIKSIKPMINPVFQYVLWNSKCFNMFCGIQSNKHRTPNPFFSPDKMNQKTPNLRNNTMIPINIHNQHRYILEYSTNKWTKRNITSRKKESISM